jgi:hypothetical protein
MDHLEDQVMVGSKLTKLNNNLLSAWLVKKQGTRR